MTLYLKNNDVFCLIINECFCLIYNTDIYTHGHKNFDIFLIFFFVEVKVTKQGISSPPWIKSKLKCLLPATVQDIDPPLSKKSEQSREYFFGKCPTILLF